MLKTFMIIKLFFFFTVGPCPVEDANNCYWDAASMGNGFGRSFVTIGQVTYYAPEVAK